MASGVQVVSGTQVASGQQAPPKPGSGRKLTSKVRLFLTAIQETPGITLTDAAKVAGFRVPMQEGSRLGKKFAQEVEQARIAGLKALKVGVEEAEQSLAEIARDPRHKDRIKALEMFLKMHGKLSDKLNLTVDRPVLNREMDELIALLREQRERENLLNPLNSPTSTLSPTITKQ